MPGCRRWSQTMEKAYVRSGWKKPATVSSGPSSSRLSARPELPELCVVQARPARNLTCAAGEVQLNDHRPVRGQGNVPGLIPKSRECGRRVEAEGEHLVPVGQPDAREALPRVRVDVDLTPLVA